MKGSGYFIELMSHYSDNQSYVLLVIKENNNGKGFKKKIYRYAFDPYFYIKTDEPDKLINDLDTFSIYHKGSVVKVKDVKKEKKTMPNGREDDVLKIICYNPNDVPMVKQALKLYGECYEYKIPYLHRFLIDTGLVPLNWLEFECEDDEIISFGKQADKKIPLNIMAFDIEVYNKSGANVDPKKDPIIMISLYNKETGGRVISYEDSDLDYVISVRNENEMIERFCDIVNEQDIDILVGYNSGMFDIPYLKERAKKLGIPLRLGLNESDISYRKYGIGATVNIPGRVHFDLYPAIRILGGMGAVHIQRYTLEEAYKNIIGAKLESKDINKAKIWEYWEKDGIRDRLFEYSLGDANATYEINKSILPVEIQLTKASRLPLSEVYRAASSKMVESALMRDAFVNGFIIPKIPKENEVRMRMMNPIEGAFVKMPEPGIYENLAVLDFRGMYPSIIVSHNIDCYSFDMLLSDDESYISPKGYRFGKNKKTLIPNVLRRLLKVRGRFKEELKKMDKTNPDYKLTFAKTQALKILINSFYGYIGYARSRWYSREAAASITAWARYYIKETINKVEEKGFRVLYGDTDSVFLLMGNNKKKDVYDFLDSLNNQLPEDMMLELEGFYSRGVFVSKRAGADKGRGAKKKYALVDEKGDIKIRGFELVRRDWSEIAKETQMKVLKAILYDGDQDKAVRIVKETIKKLRDEKVPLNKLIIFTKIKRDPKHYTIISPEIVAARKAAENGLKITRDSIIGYIIGKEGDSISNKAQYYKFAKDYDPNYYINNQVIPAVLKILKELGYSEDELKTNGKQKTLWD
ncbi:DNA polymerase [Candidatus Micrarchaeota archaeon]|nr:DNA polymerase [Candidatus Micrarchaeota archaeon]